MLVRRVEDVMPFRDEITGHGCPDADAVGKSGASVVRSSVLVAAYS